MFSVAENFLDWFYLEKLIVCLKCNSFNSLNNKVRLLVLYFAPQYLQDNILN